MTVENGQFKYDVAFSFCSEDEGPATHLSGLVQDRFSTFLYSKRQEVLSGTDGEQSFSRVFAEESRLIVIFFRATWGETPFTRFEQTAIRNRAYDHGYDFTLFIPTEPRVALPSWLPKNRLWFGWERYGLNGAASVIEARVADLGGAPHEESVLGRAARFEREAKYQKLRHEWRWGAGARDSAAELAILWEKLESLIHAVNGSGSLRLVLKRVQPRQVVLLGLNCGLRINWKQPILNNLDDSRLDVEIWDGHPPVPGGNFPFSEPRKLRSVHFNRDLVPPETAAWVETSGAKRAFSTASLAEHVLKYYLDNARGSAEPCALP